jgi:hypothetical protein
VKRVEKVLNVHWDIGNVTRVVRPLPGKLKSQSVRVQTKLTQALITRNHVSGNGMFLEMEIVMMFGDMLIK